MLLDSTQQVWYTQYIRDFVTLVSANLIGLLNYLYIWSELVTKWISTQLFAYHSTAYQLRSQLKWFISWIHTQLQAFAHTKPTFKSYSNGSISFTSYNPRFVNVMLHSRYLVLRMNDNVMLINSLHYRFSYTLHELLKYLRINSAAIYAVLLLHFEMLTILYRRVTFTRTYMIIMRDLVESLCLSLCSHLLFNLNV